MMLFTTKPRRGAPASPAGLVAAATLLGLTLFACGGTDEAKTAGPASSPAENPNAPALSKLTAHPNPANPGQSVTIQWETARAESVEFYVGGKLLARGDPQGSRSYKMGGEDLSIKVVATDGEQTAEETVTVKTTAVAATAAQRSTKSKNNAAGAAPAGRFISMKAFVPEGGTVITQGKTTWSIEVPKGGRLDIRQIKNPGAEFVCRDVSMMMVQEAPWIPVQLQVGTGAVLRDCKFGGGDDRYFHLFRNMLGGKLVFALSPSEEFQAGELLVFEVRTDRAAVCGDGGVEYAAGEQCEPKSSASCDASCKTRLDPTTVNVGSGQVLFPTQASIPAGTTVAAPFRVAADLTIENRSATLSTGTSSPRYTWAVLKGDGTVVADDRRPVIPMASLGNPEISLDKDQDYLLLLQNLGASALTDAEITATTVAR